MLLNYRWYILFFYFFVSNWELSAIITLEESECLVMQLQQPKPFFPLHGFCYLNQLALLSMRETVVVK